MTLGEFFLLPWRPVDDDDGGLGGREEEEAEADSDEGDCRFRKDLRLFSCG